MRSRVVALWWLCLAWQALGCQAPRAGESEEMTAAGAAPVASNDAGRDPYLFVDTVERGEGNDGARTFLVYVRLSAPSTREVTVLARTRDVSARGSSLPFGGWGDYQHLSRKLTFPPGVMTRSFPVMVNGDETREPDEHFEVVLSGATNATIRPGSWRATIINDDP